MVPVVEILTRFLGSGVINGAGWSECSRGSLATGRRWRSRSEEAGSIVHVHVHVRMSGVSRVWEDEDGSGKPRDDRTNDSKTTRVTKGYDSGLKR